MTDRLGWRALVEPDRGRFNGIAIHLAERSDVGLHIAQPTDFTLQRADNEAVYYEPALRLPDDLGRALLDALAAHYGGTSDTRTLRADLLHERGRVDRMIDALIRPDQPIQRQPTIPKWMLGNP